MTSKQSKGNFNAYQFVFLRLGLVLMMYQIIRIIFFITNHRFFEDVGILDYLRLSFFSLRFDLSFTFASNALMLVFLLLPFQVVNHVLYRKTVSFLFVIINSICFLFDIADIAYFPYVRKRMSADVFHLLGKQSDFIDLLPSYILEFRMTFFWIVLLLVSFIYLNTYLSKKFKYIDNQLFKINKIIIYLLTLGISIIIIRGGLQLKPIQSINGLLYAKNKDLPLVVNTPFSISHSFEQKLLETETYFSDAELSQYFQPIKQYHTGNINDKNVVFIILESFGKGYTGMSNQKSFSPFLDSLMHHSYIFSNAYANAFRSADGIPACIASIPHFMEESFATSPYATNSIDALPALLKKYNYSSSFYHGGSNGTMSFDVFASNAGFDKYYGRNEYANEKDYDGTWGIWDGPYLQYYANQLDRQTQPFFSTIFTLSSHEPFGLPPNYQNKEISKLRGIERGISYTDESLRAFFKTASTKSWFKNTLFVITADHNYLAGKRERNNYYNENLGLFAIPVLFYMPGNKDFIGNESNVFQQIDIMPTILDIIKYPKPFFSYGKSGFDTTHTPFAYCMIDNYQYMLVNNRIVGGYENKIDGVYDFATDSLMKFKLEPTDSISQIATNQYKAFKQLLAETISKNKQSSRTYLKK